MPIFLWLAVMIRQAHERPEGMDEGTLIMAGLERERVLQAIDVITTQYGQGQRVPPTWTARMRPQSCNSPAQW